MWPERVDQECRRRRLPHSVSTCVLFTLLAATAFAAVAGAQGEGEDNLPRYWEIHAWLLSLGTALFITSYLALWLKFLSRVKGIELPALATRVSKMWYSLHMYMGATGVILAVAGILVGYFMVDQAHSGQHLRITHSYIGVATGVVLAAPLATGLVYRVLTKGKRALRWWHLAIGFVAIALMLAGAISGWALE